MTNTRDGVTKALLITTFFFTTLSSVTAIAGQDKGKLDSTKMETLSADPKNLSELIVLKKDGLFATATKATNKALVSVNNDLRACGMVWHRDEPRAGGLYSVWRPQRPVSVVVNTTRNGRLVGSMTFVLRPPSQELSLLINQNGRDHDGVQSCVGAL